MAHKEKTRKGAPKVAHLGRSEARTKRMLLHYYTNVFPERKLRRILHSSGYPEAKSWAMKHGSWGLCKMLAKRLGLMPAHEPDEAL